MHSSETMLTPRLALRPQGLWAHPASSSEGPLGRLLRQSGLYPVFQPIVNLGDQTIYAHEALIRGPQGSDLHSPDALLRAAAAEQLSDEFETACLVASLQHWGQTQVPGRPSATSLRKLALSIGEVQIDGRCLTSAEDVANVAALAKHDDYSSILATALADRLAEAFAEKLHELVRRELWGYAADESLDNAALIAEAYQGIRPAPGYPACPDHTEKRTLFSLLDAERHAGMTLTESMAMLPAAAVSGFYFWHPQSQYFGLGRVGRDQLADYAVRKGWDLLEAERWLAPNLADG